MLRRLVTAAILLLLAVPATLGQQPNALTAKEKHEGWVLLVDGRTTDGWMTTKGKPLPPGHVQDGTLDPHPCH